MTQTALVTGASGVIGPPLVRRLLSRGYIVRALDRIPTKESSLSKAIEFYACDLSDKVGLEDAVSGSVLIFHLAAKLHISKPTNEDKADYWKVNVDGTRNLVEAAAKAGVRRLTFFSTINVYGPSEPGTVHDETSPIRPESWYAESKFEAEGIAQRGLPAVILRLAAVYGPGMKGNYPKLLDALQRGSFIMVGDGENRRTLVHLDDACEAAILAAEHPDAAGRVYNVTDGKIHTLREVIGAICGALNKKGPSFSLPVGFVRPAFGMMEDCLHLLGRNSSIGRSTVDKFVEDLAVSSEKIQKELGFRPKVDLVSGWRDVVRRISV